MPLLRSSALTSGAARMGTPQSIDEVIATAKKEVCDFHLVVELDLKDSVRECSELLIR
jgi:hypothetical protein